MGPVTNPAPVIAVVDDEASMRKALGRLLGTFGYETEAFADGAAFLAAQSHRDFVCVLLDLHLPGMDGWEVLKELAHQRSPLPVIVVTAEDDVGTQVRVLDRGACAYIVKPVEEERLMSEVVRILGSGGEPRFAPH